MGYLGYRGVSDMLNRFGDKKKTPYEELLETEEAQPTVYGRGGSVTDESNNAPYIMPQQSAKPPVTSELPEPGGVATSKYAKFLQEAPPTPEKPSGWRRLGAALTGGAIGATTGDAISAMAGARNVIDSPYRNALGNHNIMGQHLKEGADQESKIYNEGLARARQVSIDDDRKTDNERQARSVEALIRNRDISLEQKIEQARTIGAKIINNDNDGETYIVHPVTGNMISLGKMKRSADEHIADVKRIDDNRSTNSLSNGRLLHKDAFGYQKQLQDSGFSNSIELKKTPAGTTDAKRDSEAETANQRAFNEEFDKNPNYANFYDVNTKTFKGDPKDPSYQKLYKLLHPDKPAKKDVPQDNKSTGKIKVIGPNGQTGTADAGQVLPPGWKVVK